MLGARKYDQNEWRSSILDSVVGAYLTQNVTDALSSKAFMNLAASFPAPETVEACIDSVAWEEVQSADVVKVCPRSSLIT